MQLLVSCGAPHGTLTVDASPEDTVWDLKSKLTCKAPRLGPAGAMRLLSGGRQLDDAWPLRALSPPLAAGSTLSLAWRLRGGGGDGGSTGSESRSCYLEMYRGKQADKVDPAEELLAKWTRCHWSGEVLTPPVVTDELGNVFNKEALLQALLAKGLPPALGHITGLRSVVELKLEPLAGSRPGLYAGTGNSSSSSSSNGVGLRAMGPSSSNGAGSSSSGLPPDVRYCCPVMGVPMNGRYKFVAHRPTGLTVSEKALKEAPAVVRELFGITSGTWAADDIIYLNATGEQLELQKGRAADKVAAKKKPKKAAVAAAATAAAAGTGAEVAAEDGNGKADGVKRTVGLAGKKRTSPPPAVAAGGAAAAAAAAAPALQDPTLPPVAKKAKAAKVPAGATSEVYKSLFLSSRTQPEKETYCCRANSARGLQLT